MQVHVPLRAEVSVSVGLIALSGDQRQETKVGPETELLRGEGSTHTSGTH